jgi:hypothetical protein
MGNEYGMVINIMLNVECADCQSFHESEADKILPGKLFIFALT